MKTLLLSLLPLFSLTASADGYYNLFINEFMAENDSIITDVNDDYDDWIEIYNSDDEAVDLSGMFLTDNMSNPYKWQFPDDSSETIIPPYGYLLIWADDEPDEGPLHASFKLSAGGEEIALYSENDTLIDSITFGLQTPDISFGRTADGIGSWRAFVVPSPVASNLSWLDNIIISEIMYHPGHIIPGAEDVGEEYIELFNPSPEPFNLSGWRFSDGVEYEFPEVVLDPQQYLVVAADMNVFRAKYPGIDNVIGGWNGRLSNSGEEIALTDSNGILIDKIHYADNGDWAVRELGPLDYGHRGWIWSDEHDGDGKSLELINIMKPNEYGQNWAASKIYGGTPGFINSNTDMNYDTAPFILDVQHYPIIPLSSENVTITARIIDELSTGVTAILYYREDGEQNFMALPMFDDGLHNDNDVADGVFGVDIPAYPDGTIIEFYIESCDIASNIRTWPAKSIIDNELYQQNNLLYQVIDSIDQFEPPGGQPIYYLIMTESERAELEYIGSHFTDAWSRAQMNGTLISVEPPVDGNAKSNTIQFRYRVGIRNRGAGGRTNSGGGYRNNYHINFTNDNPWNDVTALIINNRYGYLQLLGSAVFQAAGLAAQDAETIQLRVNGQNLAQMSNHMYGSYVALESFDGDFASSHFPDDPSGNAYLCTNDHGSDLDYKGPSKESYRDYYEKNTNVAEDDFSDLINMCYVLNNTPQESFVEEVNKVVNIEQWLRYLAIDSLIVNREGGLGSTPKGDDYALYCGKEEGRFVLVPHDLDTIFGLGSGGVGPDINRDILVYAGIDGLNEFLTHPDIMPLYYQQYLDLIDTVFSPEQFNPLVDQLLSGWVAVETIDRIKQYVVQRNANILAQIDTLINEPPPPLNINIVSESDSKTVLVPTASISDDWKNNLNFDDSSWMSGTGGVGYETGSGYESYFDIDLQDEMYNGNTSCYIRIPFTFQGNTSDFDFVALSVRYDDGFIAYLNGTEIARANAPINAVWNSIASTSNPDSSAVVFENFNVTDYITLLQQGQNLLAIQGLNVSNSSDFLISVELLAGQLDAPVTESLYGTLQSDTVIGSNMTATITGDVIIPSGITLQIQEGAVLLFEQNTGITVCTGGRLIAEGTEDDRILMKPAEGADRWDGISFDNTSEDNRLICVDIEYGDQQGQSLDIDHSRVFLDEITWVVTNGRTPIMELHNPRAHIRNCTFPTISSVEPVHGTGLSGDEYCIFEGNTFGQTSGYSDIIDFSGGQRPGPIIQFYYNTFLGGGDDGLDLDAADAHIEGNIFLNFHITNANQDSPSYAVATGDGSKVCVVRNVFINNDHCILHKEDVYSWFANNTCFISTVADISFGEPFRSNPRQPGRGVYGDSNIFYATMGIFEHLYDNPQDYGPEDVYMYRSIMPQQWHQPPTWDRLGVEHPLGIGNIDANPLFVSLEDLTLQSGSPAIGAGTNGIDMGAFVPAGASVSGVSETVINQTEIVLTIGGPGITHYKWRLVDNGTAGSWSDEISLPVGVDDFPDDPDNILGTLHIADLQDGHTYHVDVLGKNSAGLWQGEQFGDTQFIAPGNPQGNSSASWTIQLD